YKITGVLGSLPIHEVRLSGRVENGQHQLQWNIVSDEAITEQVLESSPDGRTFQALTTVSNNRYSYAPARSGIMYYRLKVISAANQMVYSNVISLKAGNEKNYRLSTLVNNEISIQSFTQYQYRLVDLNGRTLKTGILPAGVQTIPVSHLSAGMYVLQLIDQNTLYAERIIKQ
ncbi:MAG TPA: T9SS type A sorting domain-containing protein, partial [Ferruginibacter sp.]|nr:T9SS type A sorting domain-containing protein [Ferruginibacter sp.]